MRRLGRERFRRLMPVGRVELGEIPRDVLLKLGDNISASRPCPGVRL